MMMRILKILLINLIVVLFLSLSTISVIGFSFHWFTRFKHIEKYPHYKIVNHYSPKEPDDFPFKGLTRYNSLISFSHVGHEKHQPPSGIVEYDNDYTINRIGSRVDLFNNSKNKKHIVLMGDSQTFGVGVEDQKVYSNLIGEKLKEEFNVYNLGFKGWGPASNFLHLDPKVSNLTNYISESSGHLTYLYFPELSERDVGTSSIFSYLYGFLTEYKIENNLLVLKGKFEDNPWLGFDRFMGMIDKGEVWDNLKRKYLPDTINRVSYSKMYNKTARIFEQMNKNYKELYPNGKFTVFICEYRDIIDLRVNKVFDQYDFEYIDLRKDDFCTGGLNYFFTENHLNSEGHRRMANTILSKLNITFEAKPSQ